jgi:integrase
VNAWTARLKAEGYAQSYVYATYRGLAQVMGDAVADGIIPRSPCSGKTAPKTGEQRPYVATTAQVWGLYEAFPEGLRSAVLLGAFVGRRLAEAAALRVSDVDFMRGVISPEIQYPAKPLKSDTSRMPIPVPQDLSLMLSAEVARTGAGVLVTSEIMRPSTPWAIERAMRDVRDEVEGLPDGFRFHDLRHYSPRCSSRQGWT